MAASPETRRARARLAAHTRWHPGDGRTACERRAELAQAARAASLEAAIQAVVELVPPLSQDQAARLRALLGETPDSNEAEAS